MSKNACRITGIITIIISVFLIIGGLYLPQAGVMPQITITSLVTGIFLLIVGIVFYKILKTDEK
ncbi:MAG: hypothetical protein K5779_07200 [Saccharofermentans sp.]|nr:hypothetical protein [Saccharofermentans sp.]